MLIYCRRNICKNEMAQIPKLQNVRICSPHIYAKHTVYNKMHHL